MAWAIQTHLDGGTGRGSLTIRARVFPQGGACARTVPARVVPGPRDGTVPTTVLRHPSVLTQFLEMVAGEAETDARGRSHLPGRRARGRDRRKHPDARDPLDILEPGRLVRQRIEAPAPIEGQLVPSEVSGLDKQLDVPSDRGPVRAQHLADHGLRERPLLRDYIEDLLAGRMAQRRLWAQLGVEGGSHGDETSRQTPPTRQDSGSSRQSESPGDCQDGRSRSTGERPHRRVSAPTLRPSTDEIHAPADNNRSRRQNDAVTELFIGERVEEGEVQSGDGDRPVRGGVNRRAGHDQFGPPVDIEIPGENPVRIALLRPQAEQAVLRDEVPVHLPTGQTDLAKPARIRGQVDLRSFVLVPLKKQHVEGIAVAVLEGAKAGQCSVEAVHLEYLDVGLVERAGVPGIRPTEFRSSICVDIARRYDRALPAGQGVLDALDEDRSPCPGGPVAGGVAIDLKERDGPVVPAGIAGRDDLHPAVAIQVDTDGVREWRREGGAGHDIEGPKAERCLPQDRHEPLDRGSGGTDKDEFVDCVVVEVGRDRTRDPNTSGNGKEARLQPLETRNRVYPNPDTGRPIRVDVAGECPCRGCTAFLSHQDLDVADGDGSVSFHDDESGGGNRDKAGWPLGERFREPD